MEARYFRNHVEPEDAFIVCKHSDAVRLEFGLSRKILGLEYQYGPRKRLLVSRSLLYREMKALGIVGRQLNLGGRFSPNASLVPGTTIGTDGSRNANGITSARYSFQHFHLGYWSLIERHRINKG